MKPLICWLRGFHPDHVLPGTFWYHLLRPRDNCGHHDYEAVNFSPPDADGHAFHDMRCKYCGKVSKGWRAADQIDMVYLDHLAEGE